jgi:hypothetical protein
MQKITLIEAERMANFLPMAVPSPVERRIDMGSPGNRVSDGTAHTSTLPSPSSTLYAANSNEIMATSSVKKKRLIREFAMLSIVTLLADHSILT